MLMIFACILILASLVLFVKYLALLKQPKVEARLDEIVQVDKNWWSKNTNKIVLLSFEFMSVQYSKKRTYLIAQKADVGDMVKLALNPKKPEDFKPYYPKLELLAIIILGVIGLGLLWFCLFMTEWLSS